MIKTDANKNSLKAIREKERLEKEKEIHAKCEAMAFARFGENHVKELTNQHKGLWYLPVLTEDGDEIERLALMRPIDRHILSYATTKMETDGLYAFLESCMSECFVEGDRDIIDDDRYFLGASQTFHKIIDSRKSYMLKR